jgi:cytochrome b561
MTTNKYSPAMQIMHWTMAILVIGMLVLGIYMDNLPEDTPNRLEYYLFHKSVGVIVLGLIILRIIIRLASRVPDMPAALPRREKVLAHWVHRLFYFGIVMATFSGFTMSSASPKRHGVEFFGYRLPDLPANETLYQVAHFLHAPIALLLIILIVLHVAGVIKHRFFDSKDKDVLTRMLP